MNLAVPSRPPPISFIQPWGTSISPTVTKGQV